MKIEYTHIVGVESNEGYVKIKFRPQGSDSAKEPVSILIAPHKDYVHVNLNFAEFEEGTNVKNLPIKIP